MIRGPAGPTESPSFTSTKAAVTTTWVARKEVQISQIGSRQVANSQFAKAEVQHIAGNAMIAPAISAQENSFISSIEKADFIGKETENAQAQTITINSQRGTASAQPLPTARNGSTSDGGGIGKAAKQAAHPNPTYAGATEVTRTHTEICGNCCYCCA